MRYGDYIVADFGNTRLYFVPQGHKSAIYKDKIFHIRACYGSSMYEITELKLVYNPWLLSLGHSLNIFSGTPDTGSFISIETF